jgi:hypothetical protein
VFESGAPCRGASRGDDCESARRSSWVTGRSGLCQLSILGWRWEGRSAGEDGTVEEWEEEEQETKVTHTVARRFACGGPEPGSVRGVASCRVRLPGFPSAASSWSTGMNWLSCWLQSLLRSDSGRWECRTKNASRYPEMALLNSSSSAWRAMSRGLGGASGRWWDCLSVMQRMGLEPG